ncbi:MAG: electron transporter RnfD [Lachnospiraceae bacterium]|nr:electron transporter RnfD [Lachnospiraceae bacterium]
MYTEFLQRHALPGEQPVSWQERTLQYCGRIDREREDGALMVYPASSVQIRFTGSSIRAVFTNIRSYWTSCMGWILDGQQYRGNLADEGETVLTLGENLGEGVHELCLFKRMDSCHMALFHGFLLAQGGQILDPPPLPERRIEVFGDSVSAGEVSEAVDYCGQPDPEHNGEYSNSYYSYAWITARKLGAQIHDIAQGGIALQNGEGYFNEPDARGMVWMYDKIQYHPNLCQPKTWDFAGYRPQLVILAFGQNDSHPVDYMAEDYDGEKARRWRADYSDFLDVLRGIYPEAHIVCKTTILEHHKSWDRAIQQVVEEKADEHIHYFAYSNNSVGTKGHIRRPEAEKMADELSAYIEQLNTEYAFWKK